MLPHIGLVWAMSAPKRARTDELANVVSLKARIPFISQSALGALLRIAKNERLPDLSGRDSVREARDQYVKLATPYGPVHQHIDLGGGVNAEVQHPMAMLYAVSARSHAFADMLVRTLERFPCSPMAPWQLILYTDEVSPGNQLAYAHERKTWAWYWSFLNFEQSLSCEETHTYIYIYVNICIHIM